MSLPPEISRILNSYASGDMYTRKAIDPKTRQLLIIAACAALGMNDNSLKAHMDTAMDYGSTPDEIKELLLYTAAGAGFPTCFWGLR